MLQFAGITLDSVKQEARLPEDKLKKCHTLLESFRKRGKVTLRELESVGKIPEGKSIPVNDLRGS